MNKQKNFAEALVLFVLCDLLTKIEGLNA